MRNNSAHLLLSALGLLAANSPAIVHQANEGLVSTSKMETLNIASLKSIESTWLEVPAACKARGFNADAIQLTQKEARIHIQSIYASYEA